MPTFRPLSQEIQRPQAEKERVRELGGDVFEVLGFIDVTNAGEASALIKFPLRFFERPNFGFGFELGENSRSPQGSFATCSGVVESWVLGRRGETGAVFYDGATILIVTTGPAEQSGTFHYRFTGGALVGSQGAVNG